MRTAEEVEYSVAMGVESKCAGPSGSGPGPGGTSGAGMVMSSAAMLSPSDSHAPSGGSGK